MSGIYTPISFDDMHSLMSEYGYRSIVIQGCKEIVYSKIVGPSLCCRVYTSIVSGQSREVGEDAIRVTLVTRMNDGSVKGVGSTTKVYRLASWRVNLVKRLEGWARLLSPACPQCGCLMASRKSKHGAFWGCVRYPECKGICQSSVTESVKG